MIPDVALVGQGSNVCEQASILQLHKQAQVLLHKLCLFVVFLGGGVGVLWGINGIAFSPINIDVHGVQECCIL